MKDALDSTTQLNIGFIGAGNMAKAIIRGMLDQGFRTEQIHASAKTETSRENIKSSLGIQCASNIEISSNCEIIVLAVKPQMLGLVCKEIAADLRKDCLIISVAAGISCSAIETWLGKHAIVRCMPNTPSAIGLGASGLFANSHVSEQQKRTAHTIMSAVGIAEYVNREELIDSVTAISGSAPAYFFLFLEAMIESGIKLGLEPSTAEKFAVQTSLGASQLALSSDTSIENLRKMVTSPNGTTEQAINSLEQSDLRGIVDQAMKACVNRAQELSQELSSDT